MNDFVSWNLVGSYAGLIMVSGVLTQLLKYFPIIEKIPTQLLTYILSFALLTASQLALNTFAAATVGLNLINAAIVSLAANGAYTAMTKVIAVQEERIEREIVVEVDKPAEESNAEIIEETEEEESQEETDNSGIQL